MANSNSNFNITKVIVDKISQEITGLEVNGKTVDLGEDFDPSKLSFQYEDERPEGLELLETIEVTADTSLDFYVVVKYDSTSVGYITVSISSD